ncbi:MAG TPA: amino acid ABC transporter permease [Chloroflexota bacterium]|jgi:putative glutamine transport system permease protein|nr:amino acid ABC transporter permease [Chloroflexota bacterium]
MQQATPTVPAGGGAPPPAGTAILNNLPLFWEGFKITVALGVLALLLALILGVIFAVLRSVPVRPLRAIGTAYVEFFRNTPLLVQTFFAYFGLGAAGIRLPAFTAAFLALGVYTGAFVTEAIRAGILAVDRGQYEAARSLGLSYVKMMRYVVLPQAFATTVPPLGNLAIALAKNTSLASSIAVADLLYNANLINSRTFATYEVFAFVGLCYLAITLPMSAALGQIERRLTRYR